MSLREGQQIHFDTARATFLVGHHSCRYSIYWQHTYTVQRLRLQITISNSILWEDLPPSVLVGWYMPSDSHAISSIYEKTSRVLNVCIDEHLGNIRYKRSRIPPLIHFMQHNHSLKNLYFSNNRCCLHRWYGSAGKRNGLDTEMRDTGSFRSGWKVVPLLEQCYHLHTLSLYPSGNHLLA